MDLNPNIFQIHIRDMNLLGVITMLTTKERNYAILKAIYFGVLPSWFYEPKCHYLKDGEGYDIKTYWQHLKMNVYIIRSLIMKTEHECTHRFHKMKIKKWTRWHY